jgi:hypothetical protein
MREMVLVGYVGFVYEKLCEIAPKLAGNIYKNKY